MYPYMPLTPFLSLDIMLSTIIGSTGGEFILLIYEKGIEIKDFHYYRLKYKP
jgi:hypothetical protein